ncbi:MAG: hypothetical protein VKO21_03195 [Candidatus Sericytochromatia bacterium]|nr:hypothetical protein [Candidatus Sericytochromatia bacterium]
MDETSATALASRDEAERLDREVDELVAIVRQPLTRLAVLIHRIREDKVYQQLGHDSFEAWIQAKRLQFSRSFVFQLAKIGRMFERVGMAPDLLPSGETEITKLAQVARLDDPELQRDILEKGYFPSGDGDRPLSEIPVRELSRLVDEKLGREPAIRPLSETYDGGGLPWEGPDRFIQDTVLAEDAEVLEHEALAHGPWGSTRAERSTAPWDPLIEQLTRLIEDLDGPDRDDAVNAVSRLYRRLVG